jgi:hypothetical protein
LQVYRTPGNKTQNQTTLWMRFKEEPGIDIVISGPLQMLTNGADSLLGPKRADLLIKLGLERLALVVVAAASVAEQGFNAVQEYLLLLTDLDGVNLIPSC